MPKSIEIVLLPAELHDEALLHRKAAAQSGLSADKISHIEVLKRSLDARGRNPVFRLRAEVFSKNEVFSPEPALLDGFRPVDARRTVIVVGAGPAGYFAALELLEQGIKPIVLDRGKDVRARRRDLRAIQQFGQVNPHSNYCFGEGGAGTYSDGKLYTRSVKRGDVRKSLRLLVEHGATPDILVDAHPHIGSNKLPNVVQNIRETILRYGGEVHFEQHVIDFILKNGRVRGVISQAVSEQFLQNPPIENAGRENEANNAPFENLRFSESQTTGKTREWLADAVVVATGHSARDIYKLLFSRNIRVEAKPFALGVRVEHPQGLIDQAQYRQPVRDPNLPASSYSLVCQVGGRGVFSFCMCPGGLVVPAATAPGEIVVNGMSMSRRDSPFANSGVVTAIEPQDLAAWQKHGVFAMLEFQKSVEQRLFAAGDGGQKGPSQRLPDFIKGRLSRTLPGTSYIPGVYPAPLHELLPDFVYRRLRDGLAQFGKLMPGYFSEETNVIGTESRTSAPVRIPRDPTSLMHPDVAGLFPCGEGAGFAGGIISAAMDGQNVARAVSLFLEK